MTKKKIKIVKSVDYMMDFKYICPNKSCCFTHWATKQEVQTKNFKIVCDCGEVFKPKLIYDIELHYEKIKPPKEKVIIKFVKVRNLNKNVKYEESSPTINKIDKKTFKEAVSTLMSFGFDKNEASAMIETEYEKTKSHNPAILVKNSLDFFGVNND